MSTEPTEPPVEKKKPKKSVGFAPPPLEDLKEHHQVLAKKEQEEIKSNPFHKIPAELAYLDKKGPGPKAIIPKEVTPRRGPSYGVYAELGDLRNTSIKDISVQNKETELNFNYPTIDLLIASTKILVDVKYGSLNSFDLSKINKYLLNLSNTKLGLGFEFAGRVIRRGNSINDEDFKVGDFVVGLVDPLSRKGSLSTYVLIDPSRDILIKVEESVLDRLDSIDVQLSFEKTPEEFEIDSDSEIPAEVLLDEEPQATEENKDTATESKPDEESESGTISQTNTLVEDSKKDSVADVESDLKDVDLSETPETTKTPESSKPVVKKKRGAFEIDPELTPMAKLASFPAMYCRAKQVLSNMKVGNRANVLINGGDTNLGYTLVQILNSDVYSFEQLNLILIIREKNYKEMEGFVQNFTKGKYYDPSKIVKVTLVTHDMVNEDLVLPGEKVPINYKKIDFFASQVIEGLFKTQYYDDDRLVSVNNIDQYKLDLFVDIVGSKKYFQHSIKFDRLDDIRLPVHDHTSNKLGELFNSKVKEPFIVKLLKPKKSGSCFVSCCRFTVAEPTYSIDKLLDYAESSVNVWASKWSSNIFNTVTYYNYAEEIELRIKKAWVLEGLRLLLDDKLKFKIDYYLDWRNNFRKYIKSLKADDGKIVFKVEDF